MHLYAIFFLGKNENAGEVASITINALKSRGFIKRGEIVDYRFFRRVMIIYRSNLRLASGTSAVKGA